MSILIATMVSRILFLQIEGKGPVPFTLASACSCDINGSEKCDYMYLPKKWRYTNIPPCDVLSGDCHCKNGHFGKKCNLCKDGYYRENHTGKCKGEKRPSNTYIGNLFYPVLTDCSFQNVIATLREARTCHVMLMANVIADMNIRV